MRLRKSSVLLGTATLALALVSSVAPARAQYRQNNNRNDQYQNNPQYQDNRNQGNTQDYHRFDESDRQMLQGWYSSHRQRPPLGFRYRDRLPPAIDSRVRPGFHIDQGSSRYYRPVPYDLARRLPYPPAGYRYVMLGDRLVLVDDYDTVRDGFSFHLNF